MIRPIRNSIIIVDTEGIEEATYLKLYDWTVRQSVKVSPQTGGIRNLAVWTVFKKPNFYLCAVRQVIKQYCAALQVIKRYVRRLVLSSSLDNLGDFAREVIGFSLGRCFGVDAHCIFSATCTGE